MKEYLIVLGCVLAAGCIGFFLKKLDLPIYYIVFAVIAAAVFGYFLKVFLIKNR